MDYKEQVDRLTKEWKDHDNIIVAVDFDDTIFPFKLATQEKCDNVIKLLKEVRSTGAYIIIHTCSDLNRYDEIKEYCKNKGLEIDGINKNPIDLPYGHHGKPYANIYLDDRAGLELAFVILQDSMYKQRGHLEQIKLQNLPDLT